MVSPHVPCLVKLPQVNPLMIRIETKAGHGAGKPTTKIVSNCSSLSSSVGPLLTISIIVVLPPMNNYFNGACLCTGKA